MNIGDKIVFNGIEYTVTMIEEDTVHMESNGIGICVLKTLLEQ